MLNKRSSFSDPTFVTTGIHSALLARHGSFVGERRGIFRMPGRRFLKHFWPPAIF